MAVPSIYVISAMCGNFWRESNINPGIYESLYKFDGWDYTYKNNTGGYGLGQWTNTKGNPHGRLWNLNQWITSQGYSMDDMTGQLAYIEVENVWNKGTSYQKEIPYNTLSDFLSSTSTDLNELTKAWNYCWEGINDGTLAERQGYAKECYDYILANANNIPTEYYHSNNWLSNDQRKHNALVVYGILSQGTIPTPGPEPEPGTNNFLKYGAYRDIIRRLILHA